MSVSTKELFTAFFKGLAFAKGLNFGEKNRGMAEDRWITIHPWGMSQGEADAGEGKGYYRRIEIDDETGEIEKGLGAGTNIKDLSKTLKDKKNSQENESTSKKTVKEPTTLRDKIKALTDGKEYTEEVANQVGDLLRQELEKNQEYVKIVSDMEVKDNEMTKLIADRKKFDLEKADLISQEYKNNPIISEYEKLKKEYTNLLYSEKISSEEYNKLVHSKEYTDLSEKAHHERIEINFKVEKIRLEMAKKADAIKKEREKLSGELITAIRDTLKDVVGFRNDGVNISANNTELKQKLNEGLRLFPKNLLDTIEKSGVKANFSLGRSAFSPGKNTVEVNDSLSGIVHEFAHCLEHNNPQILKIEEEFYNRRTKDEKLKTMKAVTGDSGYRMDERTRTDKFLDPYMGKDYGFARYYNMKKMSKKFAVGDIGEYSQEDYKPDGYELLSMGVETLIEKPHLLRKDPDYANFVLGCLACKG